MKTQTTKMMPHSLEAEQALLGCLLIDNETPLYVMAHINEEDFYVESHSAIYECMRAIYVRSAPIDFVTLTDELEKHSMLDSVGGLEYITTLTNIVPSAVNYKHYADIVKRCSVLRQLISAGKNIVEKAYESENKEEAIAYAEKQVFDIAKKEDTSELEHASTIVKNVIEKIDEIAKDNSRTKGVLTGITEFDKITNGLQKSDLILLAARPAVGKSSFAMQIVNHASIQGKKCAVFSLEMSKEQVVQRSLCSVACVSMEKVKNGNLDIEEWKSLWSASKQLSESGLYVDSSSLITPMEILSKCRRLQREHGLDLIMIDYLQLMNSGTGKKDSNRQQEISDMTRYLKIAAKELNVPILVLSQLSRAVETRKENGHRPMLSDLRESGVIEQDADIVLFIHKPDLYNDIVVEEPGICELIIAKHRNGETGTVKMRWVGEYVTFIDANKTLPKKQTKYESNAPSFDADELEKALTPPPEE